MPELTLPRLVAAGAMLLMTSTCTAPAQDAQPEAGAQAIKSPALTPGRTNAALQYYANWLLLEPLLDFEPTDDESGMMDEGPLPERYLALLDEHADDIERLIEATTLQRCDFGSNLEAGPGAVLPHLREMRMTTYFLARDARRLIETDPDAATQRLAAIIRMGEHATQGGTIIGSLVGVAIVSTARDDIAAYIDAEHLNNQHANELLSALDRLDGEDPTRALEAIRTERDMMTTWVASHFAERDKLITFISELPANPDALKNLSVDELQAQSELMRQGYDDLIAAWNADDPRAEFQSVEERVRAGEYGLIAGLLLPSADKMQERAAEFKASLDTLRKTLRAIENE